MYTEKDLVESTMVLGKVYKNSIYGSDDVQYLLNGYIKRLMNISEEILRMVILKYLKVMVPF